MRPRRNQDIFLCSIALLCVVVVLVISRMTYMFQPETWLLIPFLSIVLSFYIHPLTTSGFYGILSVVLYAAKGLGAPDWGVFLPYMLEIGVGMLVVSTAKYVYRLWDIPTAILAVFVGRLTFAASLMTISYIRNGSSPLSALRAIFLKQIPGMILLLMLIPAVLYAIRKHTNLREERFSI